MKIAFLFEILFILLSTNVFGRNGYTYLLSDSTDRQIKYIIKKIEIRGNKVTKDQIIFRELSFKINDTVKASELEPMFERSRDNLLKTSLFNYVYFDTLTEESNLLKIGIRLEERWYTWPEFELSHADRNFSAWWQSRDFSRLNYGFGLSQYNFRGRREKISIRFITGFTTQYGFIYENIHLDRQQKHSLNIAAFYDTQNKLEYITEKNRPKIIEANDIIYRKQNYFLQYTYRNKLYDTHQFIFGYANYKVSDTIVSLNPGFLGSDKSQSNFLTLIYSFESDHTDLKYYPLTGSLLKCSFAYSGLLHSNFNKTELRAAYYRFQKLHNRFYANAGLKMQLTGHTRIPYIVIMGLGYDDFLRGYENYVVDGYNFLLFKSSIKYQLIPVKIIKLNFLPWRQFNKIHIASYLNLFFDAGYVHDYYNEYKQLDNDLVDKTLYSFGAGIDLVTYYDKMLRIDFAHNSIGDFGIFISVGRKF